jgi:hypothetical protein
MPPIRSPLTPISGNRLPNIQYNSFQRGLFIGAAKAGLFSAQIACGFRVFDFSVRFILNNRDKLNELGEYEKRSDRPRLYERRDVSRIVREIRVNPNLIYAQLIQGLGLNIGHQTVRKILDI